jgi:hypothetical protein
MKWFGLKFLCFFCLVASASHVFPQSEPEGSGYVIEMQRQIATGERVNYRPEGGRMQRKGIVDSIGIDYLSIGGKEVRLDDLELLVLRDSRQKRRGFLIACIGLVSEPIILLSLVFAVHTMRGTTSTGQRIFIAFILLFGIVLSPLLLIIGLILAAASFKRYDLRKEWGVRIAPKA